jgi:hypothetical protein
MELLRPPLLFVHFADYLLACGQENGAISFYAAKKASGAAQLDFQLYGCVDSRHAHVATVRRIRWRPEQDITSSKKISFATASTDRSVRLFSIDVAKLL